MIKNLKILIEPRLYFSFFLIILAIFIGAILELISVASIPIFISLIIQPDIFFNNVSKYIEISNYITLIDYNKLIFYFAFTLLLLFFIKSAYQLLVVYLENLFLLKFTTALGTKIYKNYLLSDFYFHISINKSVLLNTLSTELDKTRYFLLCLTTTIKDFALLIFFLGLLFFWIGFIIPFTVFIILGFFGLLTYKITRKNIQKRGIIALSFRESQNRSVSQSLNAIKEVIIYKSEVYFIKLFTKYLKGNQIQSLYNSIFTQLPKPILELTSLFIILSIVLYYIEINNSDYILTAMSLLAVSLMRMMPAVNSLTSNFLSMKFNKASVDIIVKESLRTNSIETQDDIKLDSFNKIIFDKISFVYPDKKKYILKNISFEIKKNTSNAIIGTSGSGKTTIINLLLGLIKPSSGTISINNLQMPNILNDWRKLIGYVPQNVYLLDESIIKNIAFANDDNLIDLEKIKKVAKIAQLEDYINSLEDGYNSILGENGINISGGQIQRIGIARALYRDPDILIFDEATSALDNETEKNLLKEIVNLKDSYTIISISHRISTIENFDNILKIHNNEINKVNKENL